MELTDWGRLWSAPWLGKAFGRTEITGRGESLVCADGLDQLRMDRLHAPIVTTPPSGQVEPWNDSPLR